MRNISGYAGRIRAEPPTRMRIVTPNYLNLVVGRARSDRQLDSDRTPDAVPEGIHRSKCQTSNSDFFSADSTNHELLLGAAIALVPSSSCGTATSAAPSRGPQFLTAAQLLTEQWLAVTSWLPDAPRSRACVRAKFWAGDLGSGPVSAHMLPRRGLGERLRTSGRLEPSVTPLMNRTVGQPLYPGRQEGGAGCRIS